MFVKGSIGAYTNVAYLHTYTPRHIHAYVHTGIHIHACMHACIHTYSLGLSGAGRVGGFGFGSASCSG